MDANEPVNILTLNLGSSSLKYAVHAARDGKLERVLARDRSTSAQPEAAAQAASEAIADAMAEAGRIDATGHRIVFGGSFDAPALVSNGLLEELRSLQSLDPLHAPGALAVLGEARSALPKAVHVACFDTAFFRDLPQSSRVLPVPADDPLLRRYGFHGLSFEYACGTLGAQLRRRTIVAHLGSGASAAAILDGRPVQTTMGFSPLGGVLMSSRPGDLDPGVLLYLLERDELSVAQLREMLENRSGLRALSGGEGDVQKLCERADPGAAFAVEMFVRSVAAAIAALATELGGLDMLAFTGGIGEHNLRVRSEISARVRFLNPAVTVRVVKSDENAVIAAHTARLALGGTTVTP